MSATTTFSSHKHQQKVEELVATAKEQGYLTYEEINEILPMTFDSPEQLDLVLIYLSGMDIPILRNQAEVERQKERKKRSQGIGRSSKAKRRNLRRSCPYVSEGNGSCSSPHA